MTASFRAYSAAADVDPAQVYRIGLRAIPFLFAFGDLLVGWLLLLQARMALWQLDEPATENDAFYRGKITVAKFF